jgi:hypothetical protein
MTEFALQSTKSDARARVSATFIRLTSAKKPIPDNLHKNNTALSTTTDTKSQHIHQIILL